jgi:hypothetical protein
MTFCCFERATPQLAHVVRDVEWNALLNIVSRAPQHVQKNCSSTIDGNVKQVYLSGRAAEPLLCWLASKHPQCFQRVERYKTAVCEGAGRCLGRNDVDPRRHAFGQHAALYTFEPVDGQTAHTDTEEGVPQYIVACCDDCEPTLVFDASDATYDPEEVLLLPAAQLKSRMRPAVPGAMSVGDMLCIVGPVVHAGPPVSRRPHAVETAQPLRVVGFFSSHTPEKEPYDPLYQRLPWVHAQERLMLLIDALQAPFLNAMATPVNQHYADLVRVLILDELRKSQQYADLLRVLTDHARTGNSPWLHWPSRAELRVSRRTLVFKEEVANVCRGLPHRLLQALLQQDT